MSAARLIGALALPLEARVDRRIPKKLLLEHGTPTAADRRLVQESIEVLTWEAALKPSTVGTSAYIDEVREYLEIAVVTAVLRPGARAARLIELIHRAIPYPLVLATELDGAATLSLAPKRRSEARADRFVVEFIETTAPLHFAAPSPAEARFLADLALAAQPRDDLHALYHGWIGCITALGAARITGHFAPAGSPGRTATRRGLLDEYESSDLDLKRMRAAATKETQLNRRVELNLEIRRLEERIEQLRSEL